MRRIILVIFTFVLPLWSVADDFLRELPTDQFRKVLTPENFKNMDAVIILKEQSFNIEEDEIIYKGVELPSINTSWTKVIIAKLFNEKAVQRYGSFEFEYPEKFGDEIRNGFMARARVMKPDGSVWTMPDDEVKTIVSRRTSRGTPIARKVLFKIPDLAAGDIVQIEYQYLDVYALSVSGIFYYNDKDFTLYSNLYITLPFKIDARYLNLPADQIGEPRIEQLSKSYGSGKTYFWSVKNLQPIPGENYSIPFEDRSLMTAFIVEKLNRKYIGDWGSLTHEFYENYIDKDEVNGDHIRELGFDSAPPDTSVSFTTVDSLYKGIRKSLELTSYNALYPQSDDIDDIFKSGRGDASDLSYIMYRILRQWNQKADLVWIRDRREGIYEQSVPSTNWFDRLGVLVTVKGEETLYDFDRSVPEEYVVPWYLKGINVVVIGKNTFNHKKITAPVLSSHNTCEESHILHFTGNFTVRDSMCLEYTGSHAEQLRGKYHDLEPEELSKQFGSQCAANCISSPDTIVFNNFRSEKNVRVGVKGPSEIKVAQVDSFITFKLRNQSLQKLHDELFTTLRFGHVSFNGPMQMNIKWKVQLPDGFKVKGDHPGNQKYKGPSQSRASIDYDISGDVLIVTGTVNFPIDFIQVNQFAELLKFLTGILDQINKDIVLVKV